MPHVDLKFITRNLTEIQQNAISDDIIAVLKKHFGSSDDSVSIKLNEIPADDWKSAVYEPIIKPDLDVLIKKPGYKLD
ncbi:Tautomerase PptA [Rouxiella silvae]|uniref:Tautomerase PptA n=1 Tax=Rouxiella silvae TaxID=1646373 RepID=A0AA40X239_9GAMM|nr:tautomerase PptA [Rouxiella silvae]KQN52225.1 Tautomerase PptA [Serratia sp. Leaf50]MBF6637338.1 tautomerase PptA [Rouxiella silvae]ORJ19931.1 Tautomerase PptA [Rouxiella silvae]